MTAYGSLIKDLENAILCDTDDRRAETLRRVTDLFIARAGQYSADQIGLFDDVIGRLAAELEVKARAKLAGRLAVVANAPPRVIEALALDAHIDVAGPVLARSERLSEEALVNTATTSGQQHLLAISQRRLLTEAVTDVLVVRGDQQVVRSVTRNAGARFSDAGFGILVKRSDNDDFLAETVGLRRDIPRHHFLKLIANASDTVRTKLAAATPNAAAEIQSVLAEVVGRIRAESVTASRDYGAAKTAIEARMRAGRFNENDIYAVAKAGKFEDATVALALMCKVPIDVVEAAMLDNRPDMVLLLGKFAGLSWTTVKSLLLLRATDRGVSAHDLELALKSFERLKFGTAESVVQFYRTRRQDG